MTLWILPCGWYSGTMVKTQCDTLDSAIRPRLLKHGKKPQFNFPMIEHKRLNCNTNFKKFYICSPVKIISDLCCVFEPSLGCLRTWKLVKTLFVTFFVHFFCLCTFHNLFQTRHIYEKYILLHIATYLLVCSDNLAWLKSGNHA